MLKIYNTLTRKKELFKPIKEKQVSLYTCGPTVYNYAHIGNFRSYIFGDILKRYLAYKGYKVRHVMNITDVDDKTIANSRKEGISLKDFTGKYEKFFFEDLKALNIEPADEFPRATNYIPEMVSIIKKLMKEGLAYKAHDGIYFSISKCKGYGKLAQLGKTKLIAGKRVRSDEYDKESVQDFALWKFLDSGDGDVFWDTEIGKGRPGWHIECSAMSSSLLGQPIDIHTGGIDLVFPHHQNEIVQSEGAFSKKFVNYWMHCAHLIVDGKKMSKSLGNFYTLRDLLDKGLNQRAIRYLLLSVQYRQQLNFSFGEVKAVTKTVELLVDFVSRLREVKNKGKSGNVDKLIERSIGEFEAAMDDDLNVSEALASVFYLVKESNKLMANNKLNVIEAQKLVKAIEKIDSVLGILQDDKQSIDNEIEELIKKREAARKSGNFSESDRIRFLLKQKNIILEDTKDGVRWRKAL